MLLDAFTPQLVPCMVAQQSAGSAILWMVVMVLLVISGAAALYLIRRKLLAERDEDGSVGAGLTLHDLRMLHQRGSLSDQEFESAKRTILGKMGEQLSKSPLSPESVKGKGRSAPGIHLSGEQNQKKRPGSSSDRI